MVVATALLGMVTMILTTLNERRREMAILRSVGARPRTILGLLVAEAGMLTLAGVVLGIVLLYAALIAAAALHRPHVRAASADRSPEAREWLTLGIIVVAGCRGRASAGAARLPAVAGRRHDGTNMIERSSNMIETGCNRCYALR